jgi:hypothetical protein
MGVDTRGGAASTFLSGVPSTSGNATTPGSIFGENLHMLTVGELATVTPAGTVAATQNGVVGGGTNNVQGGGTFTSSPVGTGSNAITATFTGTPFGSNTPHNTVERSILVYWNLKL